MCLKSVIFSVKSAGFLFLNSVIYMKLQHCSAVLISDIIIPAP